MPLSERALALGHSSGPGGAPLRLWLIGQALTGRADVARGVSGPDRRYAEHTAAAAVCLADCVLELLAADLAAPPPPPPEGGLFPQ